MRWVTNNTGDGVRSGVIDGDSVHPQRAPATARGLVIERRGLDLQPNRAEEDIAGFTPCNDWTAREHRVVELLDRMDRTSGELLACVSRGTDFRPEAVIGSGTVPGGRLLEHVNTADLGDVTGRLQPGRR